MKSKASGTTQHNSRGGQGCLCKPIVNTSRISVLGFANSCLARIRSVAATGHFAQTNLQQIYRHTPLHFCISVSLITMAVLQNQETWKKTPKHLIFMKQYPEGGRRELQVKTTALHCFIWWSISEHLRWKQVTVPNFMWFFPLLLICCCRNQTKVACPISSYYLYLLFFSHSIISLTWEVY